MTEETVTFRSNSRFYLKEKTGRKNNTVWLFDEEDARFKILMGWKNTGDFGYICINNEDYSDGFIRKVRDVSLYKNIMVITWHQRYRKK